MRQSSGRMGTRGTTLGARLAVLVAVAMLPLLVGGAVLGVIEGRAERDAAEARLVAGAQVAARAIDAEIEARRQALLAFGSGIDATRVAADLAAADGAARRLADALGTPLGLLDRGLGMLVDTSQPFGTPLASTPAIAAGLWAVETGRPRVSDMLNGPAGALLPPMLMVPLMRDGRTEAVLSLPLRPDRLAAAMGPGRAVLLDSRGRIVASLGAQPADLPDWPALVALPRGVASPVATAGGPTVDVVVAALQEAPEWRLVALGAPAPAVAGLLPWALGLVVLCALGALAAWRATLGGLRAPLDDLLRQADATTLALREDSPAPAAPAPSGPAEIAMLGAALAEADAASRDQSRRLRALAEAGALVLWRADAGGGWIEAAGWAGLTGQAAPAFRKDGWVEMLHPDDRAPTLAEWGRCLVARQTIGVEFRLRTAGEGTTWRWVRATGVPVSTEDGQLVEWVGAVHDVADARGAGTAHRFNEAQVRQTVAELRAVYDNVPVGLALVDTTLRFVNVNARFAAISGLPPEAHVARAPHDVMPEGLATPLESAQQEVLRTGRPVLDVTCTGQAPGAVQHLRHWLASCHPVKDSDGVVTGVSAVLQDVTERVRAERSRELLVTELNHRVKNTLSTVQSIAAQSLRRAGGDSTGFGRDFVGRLQALTRSHDLLAEGGWEPVDLARVVQAALGPWLGSGRAIRIAGSGRIQVEAPQAQALVLALHELATNAVRHGALSRPGGEVDTTWSLGEDGIAHFEWRESGGPPVSPPNAERRGFGVRLLERGLVHDLGPGAEVKLQFPEEGVRAILNFRVGLPSLLRAEAR
ncbi:PAS domain-containing protein [Roseomonas sp. CECT 9278]|uniref:PAS domain-containing protein n=1 Tax=Roseomonas sp. CECT 9278 TaxID=2845823 RepID=UPI001E445074|nr:PAS domain-containing protein [Roseomonas sp. CECT 9278]